MLQFLENCSTFCFLDNHGYEFDSSYECLAAAGALKWVQGNPDSPVFSPLDDLHRTYTDWIFGHICYDTKNAIESLESKHPDAVGFPDLHFFIPETVLLLHPGHVEIGVTGNQDAGDLFRRISSLEIRPQMPPEKAQFLSRFTREEYIKTVGRLQEHIVRGDCYEVNFCQEFYSHQSIPFPTEVFKRLSERSPSPFSACYRCQDQYLLCASPERFLKRTGDCLIAQPMKGTSKRILEDLPADLREKSALARDEKERAENIMIVDLVRNDLSKVCTEGSVHVKNFLEVHTFPQVHQMISTVEGRLPPGITTGRILEATFPMGSMTGAPKKRVMELIETYEKTRRGLYSGTVGYLDPEGNFDFNVVIRSILYNSARQYISIQCGSAITFNSDPEKEYEECLLKASALFSALG